MLRIEIKSVETKKKEGTSKFGKPYSFLEQEGWCQVDGEVRRVRITLADGAAAWPVGVYSVDDASYYVGGFGELALGRLVLKAATAAVPRAASA
jgi:hypothetical protein